MAGREVDMWRYDALLPFAAGEAVSLGEGGTPLVAAPRLARRVGVRVLWIKDESRNPTWSFKDRSNAVGATHARALGSPALVVSSTGNAAAATAAYARRAGIPAIVLVAKSVDPIMSGFVQSYGAHVVMTETKPDRWVMMKHCVEAWDCYPTGNYQTPPVGLNPYMTDGYKTIGFEIWEQLGRRAPDWIFAPAGYTNGLAGIFQGFQELAAMGLAAVPHLGAAEIYGSLVRAIEEGSDVVQPARIDRPTVAISIGTSQNTYQAVAAIRGSGGTATQVADEEILSAQERMIESEGMFPETTSATGLAALIRELEAGRISRDAEVVIVMTSTGLKSLNVTAHLRPPVPMAHSVESFSEVLKATYGFNPEAE
ncbi:MAG: hypothetical protein A2V88_08555 [Elusimicrobia bacterium RBG_16_66_12]|nr:MAG: hypothetical protein A2V88_08555 [Elusimicrobia bacterium RBG_16_66_12]